MRPSDYIRQIASTPVEGREAMRVHSFGQSPSALPYVPDVRDFYERPSRTAPVSPGQPGEVTDTPDEQRMLRRIMKVLGLTVQEARNWLYEQVYYSGDSPIDLNQVSTLLMTMFGSTGAQRTATSWRGMTDSAFWLDYDVVVTTEGGASGRKRYEVYVMGRIIATRPTLAEAKAVVESEHGELQWGVKRLRPVEVDHEYFGPTTEFTAPTTIWVASLN